MPHKPNTERAGPQISTYRVDYNTVEHEKLVDKIPTSFDKEPDDVTTYHYAYGTGNPNKSTLNMMSNDRLLAPCTLEGTRPTVKPKWVTHGTVASCLTWHPHSSIANSTTTPHTDQHLQPAPTARPMTANATVTYPSPPIIAA